MGLLQKPFFEAYPKQSFLQSRLFSARRFRHSHYTPVWPFVKEDRGIVLEPRAGFEPAPAAWKADMLSVEHQRGFRVSRKCYECQHFV